MCAENHKIIKEVYTFSRIGVGGGGVDFAQIPRV